MKFKVNDIVEYTGNFSVLSGLQGSIIEIDNDYMHVKFDNYPSFYIHENDLQVINNVTTHFNGYEPVAIPFENNNISFSNIHKCEWKLYFGLNQKFEFCTICDNKRNIE